MGEDVGMDMVERVARAAMDAFKAEMGGHRIPGDVAPDSWTANGGSVDFEVVARAAIEAMRSNLETLPRYDWAGAGWIGLEEDANGDWVKRDDVLAALSTPKGSRE